MPESSSERRSICFVGLQNLPVLAPEYARPGIGGAERQQTLLARALVRQGFDVSMVVHDYGQPERAVWDGITTFRAYPPKVGIPVVRFVHPRWTGIWRAMRRANADIYYVSCCGMLIGEVSMFARWHGRKTIFRVANDSDCDPQLKRVTYARDRWLYRYGLRHVDLILAQTVTQQSLLEANFGRTSRVVPSLNDLGGQCLAREQRDIPVLWIANIRQQKRPDRLLELARCLPHVQFHMVGGPVNEQEGLFESIRQAAQQLPNVRFHGFVPYEQIAPLYERARLFVNTSESEGFPNTYMQAWARGTPVVGLFDPDGIIARAGLGRAAATIDEMPSAITHLLDDEAAWQAASERCRAHIARHGDEASMLQPYLDALASLGADGANAAHPTSNAPPSSPWPSSYQS